MIQLSDRLNKLASYVKKGDRVADIGTDHGYIPIYLKQMKIADYIIATDMREGPLGKMQGNLERFLKGNTTGIEMRKGDGLSVLSPYEVDSVIIAGMGGMLMMEILSEEIGKVKTYKQLILQPRNAQEKLRKWLIVNGFEVNDEVLVREGKFIWEILVASPVEYAIVPMTEEQYYDIGEHLIRKKDPLLREFVQNKIRSEENLLNQLALSEKQDASEKREEIRKKIAYLRRIFAHECENEGLDQSD